MDLVNDPLARGLGILGGALFIGYGIVKAWLKEAKEQAETKRAAHIAVPALMQQLAAAGTPMSALSVDATNELHKSIELLTLEVKGLRQEMVEHRRDTREYQIAEKAFREGAEARGRR